MRDLKVCDVLPFEILVFTKQHAVVSVFRSTASPFFLLALLSRAKNEIDAVERV
jgi:hypothetical protein